MSRERKANPALIGVFVLGAVVLAGAAVVVFGSGRFFRRTVTLYCYFSGSVNGLNTGAPVKFRGVQIGSVTAIRLLLRNRAVTSLDEVRIPVAIEIDETLISDLGGRGFVLDRDRLDALIAGGLRAQLQTESFVTGVLYVGLDAFPGSPVVLVLPKDAGVLEVPTMPTTLEQASQAFRSVMNRLDKLDLEGLVGAVRNAVDGVNTFVRSPELDQALTIAREALASIRRVSQSLEPGVGPTIRSLQATSADVRASLQQLDVTLTELRSLIDPQAPLAVELARTLGALGDAAQSVRSLADYLDRNPSAILTGRPGS